MASVEFGGTVLFVKRRSRELAAFGGLKGFANVAEHGSWLHAK